MPRYRKLGYVALNVTDMARSRHFYEKQLGLQPAGEGERGEAFFRCGTDHHNIVLYPAAEAGLKRIGFAMESEEALAELLPHFLSAEIEVNEVETAECRALRQGRTLRISDPFTGATFEFYAVMREFAQGFVPTLAKIQRIGHVVLKVAEFEDACAFYTRILGFRVSDLIDGQASFMRAHPNPYHHGVALIKGPAPLLHHVNFMVSEIDDVGRAIGRFTKSGVPIVYGPGRHPPSGSVFLYFLEPDGMTLEYSFGMEEFPEEGARKPRLLEPIRESYDAWGSLQAQDRYARVGAIERLVKAKAVA